jgi:hypothetical protein
VRDSVIRRRQETVARLNVLHKDVKQNILLSSVIPHIIEVDNILLELPQTRLPKGHPPVPENESLVTAQLALSTADFIICATTYDLLDKYLKVLENDVLIIRSNDNRLHLENFRGAARIVVDRLNEVELSLLTNEEELKQLTYIDLSTMNGIIVELEDKYARVFARHSESPTQTMEFQKFEILIILVSLFIATAQALYFISVHQ